MFPVAVRQIDVGGMSGVILVSVLFFAFFLSVEEGKGAHFTLHNVPDSFFFPRGVV